MVDYEGIRPPGFYELPFVGDAPPLNNLKGDYLCITVPNRAEDGFRDFSQVQSYGISRWTGKCWVSKHDQVIRACSMEPLPKLSIWSFVQNPTEATRDRDA